MLPNKNMIKEVRKMIIDYELYEMICEMLLNEENSIEEIAQQLNTSVEIVSYVDRAENDEA